jgi:hypothetical protein
MMIITSKFERVCSNFQVMIGHWIYATILDQVKWILIVTVVYRVSIFIFPLVLLSLNNQIIRLLSDLGNAPAVFESLQYRMAKPALWHAPEDASFNVFESELIHYQQSHFLTV